MDHDELDMCCEELRELAENYPREMEVIVEMLIDADEELCRDS